MLQVTEGVVCCQVTEGVVCVVKSLVVLFMVRGD